MVPMLEPGCKVGRSVPAARGRLLVGCGVDWLEPPAGGFCVVVNGVCAMAEALPRSAAAIKSFFMEICPVFSSWFYLVQ